MKKLLVFAVLIGAVVLVGPRLWNEWMAANSEDAVRLRVKRMLDAMAEEPPDEQLALSTWGRDKIIATEEELKALYNSFLHFWRGSGLSSAKEWTVSSVEPTDEEGVFLVTVSSASGQVQLRVPPGREIEPVG